MTQLPGGSPRTFLLVLLAAIVCGGAWLRIAGRASSHKTPDEKVYEYYVGKVLEDPLRGAANASLLYNNATWLWPYPVPLRVAYYYTIAGVCALFRASPEAAAVGMAKASSILVLVLVAWIGLRFFNAGAALAAAALLSVSPQSLVLSTRIWNDSINTGIATLLFWFCAEIYTRQRPRGWYAAFWIFSVYFVLLKETGGLFYSACVAGLMLVEWDRTRSWREVLKVVAGAVITAVCALGLMTWLCGGPKTVLGVLHNAGKIVPVNPYAMVYQSGPWYSLAFAYWALCPLATLGCAAALFALLPPGIPLARWLRLDARQRGLAYWLAWIVLFILTCATIAPYFMNLRYVSFLAGPFYLMAALGLWFLLARLQAVLGPQRRSLARLVAAAVILGACAVDYRTYLRIYVEHGVNDLDVRRIANDAFVHSP